MISSVDCSRQAHALSTSRSAGAAIAKGVAHARTIPANTPRTLVRAYLVDGPWHPLLPLSWQRAVEVVSGSSNSTARLTAERACQSLLFCMAKARDR